MTNQPTESRALAKVEQNLATLGTQAEQAARETVAVASAQARVLAEIIDSRGLYTTIGNGKHVEIEGWELAATFRHLGVGVDKTEAIRDAEGNIIGYRAHAIVRNTDTGNIVSEAWHMCTLSEPKWKGKPLFNLESMAGTRACSKALRMSLSWVMVLGGYAPTPAEEMDGVAAERSAPASKSAPERDSGVPCATCGAETFAFKDGKMRGHKTGQKDAQGKDIWHRQPVAAEKPAEAPAPRPEAKTPPVVEGEVVKPGAKTEPLFDQGGELHDGNWQPKSWDVCYNAIEAQFRIGPTLAKRLADEAGRGQTPQDMWAFHWQRWEASRAPAPKGGAA